MGVLRSGTLAATLVGLALAALPATGRAYTIEQQQACTPDAFRLCGAHIPDVDRITACMIQNRALLSPACAVYFRAQPAPEAAEERPMNMGRASLRKATAAKRRKAKRIRTEAN